MKDNKSVYFEKELGPSDIPKPDLQNFVKLETI